MNALAVSRAVASLHSGAAMLAVLALLAGSASPAEAGAQNIPCKRPFVFQGAAVNVVVLPYQSVPELTGGSGIGERLPALVQLEVLRSIAKFGSVGAVHMVGPPNECEPDLVVAKLLGTVPGAATTLGKGKGLVVVWGRFFTEGGVVFVQTFCRLLRVGADETLDLVAAGQRFSGQLSAQAFACAARRVTIEDLRNFERQFSDSMMVRAEPSDGASGSRMPPEPFPYWISDSRGDWMKIDSQGGPKGWIRLSGANDAWSLTRWLPELAYLEGMVGYLRYRMSAWPSVPAGSQQAAGKLPDAVEPGSAKEPSRPARAAWVDAASRAFADYEQLVPAPAAGATPSMPSRTALADAVLLQIRGILVAMKPGATVVDRLNALKLFESAASALPHDANARNLVAMMQLSLALDSGRSEFSPRQAASDLLQALGSDPGNRRVLANLQSAYLALLSPPAAGAVALTEDERRSLSAQLAALKQIR
jgi:hypothetical protein